jgi:hypothetical protein
MLENYCTVVLPLSPLNPEFAAIEAVHAPERILFDTRRWLDEEVAAITEIAFDMRDTISIESVRKARSK